MAEAMMHAEIQRKIGNDMNQNDLSESAQQIEELQPFVSSQPSDLSSNYLQQQQQVEDEATIDIKEMIQDCGDGILLQECCIYRVPITLRDLKEEAYIPKVVSIGPFHYRNKRLQDMGRRHKRVLFKRFIQRTTSSLDDLIHFVRHLLPKVRASYSETVEFVTEQELVELTLMDAGFIIELFITFWTEEADKDAKLSQPWLDYFIRRDLLLLENQLPFFVIEELFNKADPHDRHSSLPSFLKLTYYYFLDFNIQKFKPNPDVKIKHFTDLLRLFHLRQIMPQRDPSDIRSQNLLYDANALQEAGIKFKASNSKCPLDLKFSGHQLEIPQIVVADHTEILFRNVIALEQCHYHHESYITDYALMLDYLVNTYKDVDLLVHNEIVINQLGDSKNVALLFNGLGVNVIESNFNSEYDDICKRLNGHCQSRWHKMKATLRHDYCRTPWQIYCCNCTPLTTDVQTIFSILQVVKK